MNQPRGISKYDTKNSVKAVGRAVTSRVPSIIVDDLEKNYREAVAAKSSSNYYPDLLNKQYRNGTIKTASRSVQAFTVDRVFEAPYNPFRSRFAIETPQNRIELYQRYRYYFKYEPLVGTAIELHSEFPLSSFELLHEDSTLQEEFNDIAHNLNLEEFMQHMAIEYWLVGSVFTYGIFDDDKNPSVWKSFSLLNPMLIEMEQAEITDGRPNSVMKLRISDSIRRIIQNGPKHPQTGELYNRLPSDMVEAVKNKNGLMTLNPVQAYHLKRAGNYFSLYGESIISRIIHLLNYRDKLRDSMYAAADRYAAPMEHWKVGEPESPATEDELVGLTDMIGNSFNDINRVIVTHHAVSVDIHGASEKVLPVRQEINGIEEEILVGLMLNKGFLDSQYGAYANMSIALEMLISRYLTFRQRIERWQNDAVWAPLCRLNNIYRPTRAELDHRIRIKNSPKRPWTPKIVWSKHELRDSTQKINLLMQVRDKLGKPGLPKEMIYQALNLNPRTVKEKLDREIADDKQKVKVEAPPSVPGGITSLPDLTLPAPFGDGGGLEAPIGEVPEGGLPETGAPEVQMLGPAGVPAGPPESQTVQNKGTGAPGATV
jgi:hypothetical protein